MTTPLSIHTDIITTLKSSQYWTTKTKEGGRYISNVICPECGEARAFLRLRNALKRTYPAIIIRHLFIDSFKQQAKAVTNG